MSHPGDFVQMGTGQHGYGGCPTAESNVIPPEAVFEAAFLNLLSCLSFEPLEHGHIGCKTLTAIRDGWRMFPVGSKDIAGAEWGVERRGPDRMWVRKVVTTEQHGNPNLGPTPTT